MDTLEIAHSITVEAIRAGVNRPDEITGLFEGIMARAEAQRLAHPGPAVEPPPEPASVEEEEEPPAEPEVHEEPPEEPAPLPSVAWSEPEAHPPPPPPPRKASAEEIAASVAEDHITCLECGRPFKRTRQHLRHAHGLTIEEYRNKWGLPKDYPMVAPAFSREVSERTKGLIAQGRFGRGGRPAKAAK